MTKRIFSFAYSWFLGRFLRQKLRRGAIQAVRSYVLLIGQARKAVMGMAALALCSAAVMTGLVLLLGGILSLAKISVEAMAWIQFASGLALLVFSSLVLLAIFSQRRWMEMSRANELVRAVCYMTDDDAPDYAAVGSRPPRSTHA